MEAENKAKILIIDDDESFDVITTNLLKLDGHDVTYTCSAEEGLQFLEKNQDTDIVLLDIDLGAGMSGTEALPVITETYPFFQVVMITSNTTLGTALECMKKGAFDYLTKPFKKPELEKIIPSALARKKLIRLRDLYLEMLVHDLKNPLQSITMGLDAIDTNDESVTEKAMNLARYGCWQISNMISNILTITRFEKTSPTLEYEEFFLEEEIREQLRSLIHRIRFTGKQFVFTLDKKKDFTIKTEKALFFGILSNLVSNAIRFTHQGDTITVMVKKKDKHYIEVKVTNTGSFIEDRFKDKIFDKFFKTSFYKEHQKQNFGLGLTFSKLAVSVLGGKIWVESRKEPVETSFYFTVKNQN
jgi:two-component system sensor histidine kinase/response regulator